MGERPVWRASSRDRTSGVGACRLGPADDGPRGAAFLLGGSWDGTKVMVGGGSLRSSNLRDNPPPQHANIARAGDPGRPAAARKAR